MAALINQEGCHLEDSYGKYLCKTENSPTVCVMSTYCDRHKLNVDAQNTLSDA